MSVAELKQARSEKIYELGFLYYNKAVEGMEMMQEALDLINDIRSRFGYLLYLKQSDPNSPQIAEIDSQISADFVQLGETCYGYYVNNIPLDDDLKAICSFIASADEQMHRGDVIAEQISNSVNNSPLADELSESITNGNEGKELDDGDFVMPSPQISAPAEVVEDNTASAQELFENVDTDAINVLNETPKCICGFEYTPGSKFCSNCGNKLA